MTEYKQPPLTPEMRPTAIDLIIALDELPPDATLISQPPSASLVRSIEAIGVQQPIVVIDTGEGHTYRWEVAAGRRRVKAARKAGLDTIPARVYKQGELNPSLIALVENEQRSRNLRNDFVAMEQLMAEGHSEADIIAAVGIDKARYRALLRVNKLRPTIKEGWIAGTIKDSAAVAASKLTPNQQARLEETLEEKGNVKLADVRNAKRAVVTKAIDGLDDALFARPQQNVTVDNPQETPLAMFSDAELIAEVARRGLTAS